MTARWCFGAALLLLATIAGGCGGASDDLPPGDQTARLAATLAVLNLSHPVADLESNLKRGDYQFVCVMGFTRTAPGVEESDAQLLQRHGMRCLEGTSDMIEGEEHESLIRKAEKYASEYNIELLRRIHSGHVT